MAGSGGRVVALTLSLQVALGDEQQRRDALCGGLRFAIHEVPSVGDFFPANASGVTTSWTLVRGPWQPPDGYAWSGSPCSSVMSMPDICDYIVEDGGKGAKRDALPDSGLVFWASEQYSSPLQITSYVIANCLVDDPGEADAFLLGFDYEFLLRRMRPHGDAEETRKNQLQYVTEQERLLEDSPYWNEHQGRNFLLACSRPHLRALIKNPQEYPWTEMMFTTIEENSEHVLAVPYPTFFHPTSDRDVDRWLEFVRRATRDGREPGALLAAGSAGRHEFRRPLVLACEESSVCTHEIVTQDIKRAYPGIALTYLNYTFSIHPAGDTPTRRGMFDSWLTGCIPILFGQGPFAAHHQGQSKVMPAKAYSRFFAQDGDEAWIQDLALFAEDEADAVSLPSRASQKRVREIQGNILRFIPRMLYWDAERPMDADMGKWEKYGASNVVASVLREFADHLKGQAVPSS
eukprot:scaffold264_cov317-Pinguiococcus_pyrenoidosus.AAC.44